LPHRDYELLAELIACALDLDLSEDVAQRMAAAARRSGVELAGVARRLAGRRPSRRRLVEVGLEVLRLQGFDPHSHDAEVALRSCPFRTVANAHRSVVCPLNRALMEGFVEGLELKRVTVTCEPGGDGCCVTLRCDSSALVSAGRPGLIVSSSRAEG
jgi:predicted ArsR family transcriptional regulator